MHPLAAKLFHENFGVLLVSKTENLVPFLLPNHGMSGPRKRQPVCPAELLDFLIIGAGALLFDKADPVWEASFLRPFDPRLTMVHFAFCSLNVLLSKPLGMVCRQWNTPD